MRGTSLAGTAPLPVAPFRKQRARARGVILRDGIDLSDLPVALASHYNDDEPGSPWTWVLYLDVGASEEQRAALEGISSGMRGTRTAASPHQVQACRDTSA